MFEHTFSEELLTGDAVIDEQHRELFATARRLDEAIEAGRGNETVETILEELLGYAAVHFRDEEALMARIEYPGLDSQQAAHAAFATDASRMAADWMAGRGVSSAELSAHLSNWLERHVQTVDLLLARFLAAEREEPTR